LRMRANVFLIFPGFSRHTQMPHTQMPGVLNRFLSLPPGALDAASARRAAGSRGGVLVVSFFLLPSSLPSSTSPPSPTSGPWGSLIFVSSGPTGDLFEAFLGHLGALLGLLGALLGGLGAVFAVWRVSWGSLGPSRSPLRSSLVLHQPGALGAAQGPRPSWGPLR